MHDQPFGLLTFAESSDVLCLLGVPHGLEAQSATLLNTLWETTEAQKARLWVRFYDHEVHPAVRVNDNSTIVPSGKLGSAFRDLFTSTSDDVWAPLPNGEGVQHMVVANHGYDLEKGLVDDLRYIPLGAQVTFLLAPNGKSLEDVVATGLPRVQTLGDTTSRMVAWLHALLHDAAQPVMSDPQEQRSRRRL